MAVFLMLAYQLLLAFAFVTGDNFPPCRTHADGMCINYDEWSCPDGYAYAYSGCGFREKCCYPRPTEAPTTPVTKAPKLGPKCGNSSVNPDTRIVGGQRTSIAAHPWQVSVMIDDFHICGGSLISDTWVLTASHCTYRIRTSRLSVLTGTSIIQRYSNTHVYQVTKKVEHDDYDDDTLDNDIALLKLSKPLDLTNRNTRAVCLPDKRDTFDNEVCIASGWGSTEEKDQVGWQDMTTYLRHVTLPIVSKRRCQYYMGTVPSNVICGGHTSGGKDTCQGDSGGPVVCRQSDGTWVQAGVVSNGIGCARKGVLGFYSDVAAFRSWIDNAMED